jgi:hypothetical protein
MRITVKMAGIQSAFTLPELIMAGALGAMSLGGIIYGYVMSAQNAEWAAYHLAAHSLAVQRLEQARAAKWDLSATPIVDALVTTNFPVVVEVLDIPITKTNVVFATNVTTITTLSTQPPVKMIQVDCSWQFTNRRVFTNTVVTYRTKDQ